VLDVAEKHFQTPLPMPAPAAVIGHWGRGRQHPPAPVRPRSQAPPGAPNTNTNTPLRTRTRPVSATWSVERGARSAERGAGAQEQEQEPTSTPTAHRPGDEAASVIGGLIHRLYTQASARKAVVATAPGGPMRPPARMGRAAHSPSRPRSCFRLSRAVAVELVLRLAPLHHCFTSRQRVVEVVEGEARSTSTCAFWAVTTTCTRTYYIGRTIRRGPTQPHSVVPGPQLPRNDDADLVSSLDSALNSLYTCRS
jgi:hypothetical protein